MKRLILVALLMGTLLAAGIATSAQSSCVSNPDIGVSDVLNCTVVSGKGIGMSRRYEDAIIGAVDILKASGDSVVGVCLKGEGGMLFSNGNMSSRMAFWAWYYVTSDGFTCTNVSAPGVVVLVSLASPLASGQAPEGATGALTTTVDPDATPDPNAPATTGATVPSGTLVALENCTVVTRAILNFRDAPSINSNVKDLVPYRSILNAVGKQGAWFNVVYGNDNGWVAASLVNTRGAC